MVAPLLKRIFIVLVVTVVVGVAGCGVYAWRPAIGPVVHAAAASFPPAEVARGEVLAGAGYCATCHTARGGAVYAGGYGLQSSFGVVYSTNITPDPETGIGAWSEDAFRRAMREGVSRDGSHLFPAFPYDHFTRLSDADIAALYAFFMTRAPVNAPPRKSGLPFPLNIRALQAGWKLLYFRPARFAPQPGKSAEWNRGAYLAEGISHCGACHTPRNWLGAEQPDQANGGAVIDNWIAPALTAANPSPVPWNWDELFAYLRTGVSRWHGTAAGPMAPVVHDGLAKLPDADIQALAIYFADIGGAAARSGGAAPAIQKALLTDHVSEQQRFDPAIRLYTAACASCHYNGTSGPNALRPELALNSALYLDEPTNLLQVILHGINAADGAPGVVMPAFTGFSNADVAGIASYLRATRTNRPAWTDLENKVAVIRAQASQP